MLKTKHAGLLDKIAAVFFDLLQGASKVPESWFVSKLVILFKKGDTKLPKNYRPIAIIPVLVFSTTQCEFMFFPPRMAP